MNDFKKIVLERGIPLYLYKDESMKNIFFSYNVKYGSSGKWFKFNNDNKEYEVESGYAHYLEHLLGEHSPFGDMYYNFQKRLQSTNAYTAQNVTSYHFSGKDDIEKSIEELIVSMEQPGFDKKDVDATRHAIEEEAASFFDDSNITIISLLSKNLYDGYSEYDDTLSCIGNRETTKAITIDNLYNCYNAFYTDDRKYMIVGGNVDENQIVDCINNSLIKCPIHESHLILPEIDYTGIRKQDDVLYKNVNQNITGLGIKVKKPDFITQKEFNYVMSIMEKYSYLSRQANKLNRDGIIESCYYLFTENTDEYINYIISYYTKDKEASIQGLLDLFNKRDISNKDYELMKKTIIADEVRAMGNKYDYLNEIPYCIDYTESYSDIDYYQSFSYDDFSSMLNALDFSNYTVGEIKSKEKLKK